MRLRVRLEFRFGGFSMVGNRCRGSIRFRFGVRIRARIRVVINFAIHI